MCDKYTDPFQEIAADIARDVFQDGYDPQLAIADVIEELVRKVADLAEKEKAARCTDIDATLNELKEIAIKAGK